jgi:energy-coupling factor transporter ATP-binding protein EcfA2
MNYDTSSNPTKEGVTLVEQIELLKATKPALVDILIASPFDDKMDVDEKFTENIFYRELYVEDEYEKHAQKLIQTINGDLKRNTMILISGYAGTGKSTFLKTFIKRTPAFAHYYLTFDERSIYQSKHNTDDEILNLIKLYLVDSEDINRTIAFLVVNRRDLKARQLISDNLYKYTAEPTTLLPERILDVITEFDIKDTFTCFFCHLFLSLPEDKRAVIYFDNLDNVRLEFLSATFLDFFNRSIVDANVLRKIGDFAEKNISMSNFRFIFCLRDASGALVNHHLASRTQFNNVVSFRLAFRPAHYQRVLEKRIAFLPQVFDEEHIFGGIPFNTVSRFLKSLIHDSYFQKVFLPFFNKDYRTVVKALSDMLEKTEDPGSLTKELTYISRGNLLFGLINYALGENFLKRYREAEIPVEGWCYIDRVLLTFLLNGTNYNREKNEIGVLESDLVESYQLADCIKQLEKFYSVEDILTAISRCFLYHERNWAHLLTIYNVHLTREKQRHFIHETARKYANRERVNLQDSKTQEANPADRIDLNSIRIRVNIAGFTFVRYILIHFEFYSNLVRNKYPLGIRESEMSSPPKTFYFEEAIDKVLRQVQHHIGSMEKFFNDRYSGVIPIDRFYSSDLCFRHLGGSSVAVDQGYLHSTRIITSHIDYIDRFRCEVPAKFKVSDGEKLIRIHRILVEKIERYIELLRNSLDERGKRDFIDDFEEAVRAVKSALNKGDYKRAGDIKIEKQSQPKIAIKQLIPK